MPGRRSNIWTGEDATLTDAGTEAGQQVMLVEGDNVINVKVTAEDSSTTLTYEVTVNRAAATCTLNTGDLWCGVVTVGTYSGGVGFLDSSGVLTDNNGDQTITIGSDSYTVSSVVILANPAGALVMELDPKFPTIDEPTLEFHIGGSTFKVSEATFDVGVGYYWQNSGLSWSVGDMVDVRLRQSTAPTITAPTIDDVAVTSTPTSASDTYGAGETIEVTVTFSEAVTATTGTDFVLSVAGARRAPLLRGSGTEVLVFGYTVLAADEDADGIWIGNQDRTLVGDRGVGESQNGAITSMATDVAADLTHDELGVLSGHKVDGSRTVEPDEPVEPVDTTCTLNTGDLWCGVVTVENDSSAFYGFVDSTDTGALSDTGFSVGTNSYTIDNVWVGGGILNFGLTSALTTADQAKLVLYVDDNSAEFAFSTAGGPSSTQDYRWMNTGLDWSEKRSVTLRLRDTPASTNNVPARPAAPSVAGSTTSLLVTWTAPSNTGPAIDTYDLQYRQGTSGNFTDGPQDQTGTSATITGLTANTAYQVQVRATNSVGNGPWSPSGSGQTNSVGNTAPTFSSPTAMRSVAENSAAGTNVGDAVTATDTDVGDTLTYTLEGAGKASFAIVGDSGQIRTRSGVTYDYEAQPSYTVMVKADDGNGSDTVTVTIDLTDVAEPPRAPAAPRVTPNATDSLTVSWSAPSNTGRPDIDSYDLEYREGTSGSWTNGPQDVSSTSATITGLTAALTAYQVQVRATNADGDGPWSPPGRISAPSGGGGGPSEPRPAAPRNLLVKSGDGQVTLTWDAPEGDAGSAITDYEYRIDGKGRWISIGSTDTTHTITGLDNDTEYTFQVRAVNQAGPGPAVRTTATPIGNTPPVFAAAPTREFAETVGDAAPGAAVEIGDPITATDPNGDPLHYSLEGTDQEAFTISAGTGQLRTKAGRRYDHEAQASYTVTVRADDGQGGTATVDVRLDVTDAPEPPKVRGCGTARPTCR